MTMDFGPELRRSGWLVTRYPAEILALGPSCVSGTPQPKREWSRWPEFGLISGNLCDVSNGLLPDDISEFRRARPVRRIRAINRHPEAIKF